MRVPVALRVRDAVIGTFNCGRPRVNGFGPGDLQFTERFSKEVAAALHTLDLLSAQQLCTVGQSIESVNKEVALPLDEVLAGLETTGKRRFMEMLKDMHAKFGVGILIIEHDIETISNLCKRVAVLTFGELIADGTPDEVFRAPAVLSSYTGAADA